jgi:hypothetical protein
MPVVWCRCVRQLPGTRLCLPWRQAPCDLRGPNECRRWARAVDQHHGCVCQCRREILFDISPYHGVNMSIVWGIRNPPPTIPDTLETIPCAMCV